MTLSVLLQPGVTGPTSQGPMMPPDIDRTEWAWGGKGGGGGGWKGGKGNPNAALSALTLLAFLFFLNILQSCLKDSINQDPGVVVMMMPAAAAGGGAVEGVRVKRETQPEPSNREWDDDKIIDLVHNQVESYWSNKEPDQYRSGPSKSKQNQKYIPLKVSKDEKESLRGQQEQSQNKRISTKLHVFKTTQRDEEVNRVPDLKTLDDRLSSGSRTEEKLIVKEKPSTNTNWKKILTIALQTSKPLVRILLCCDAVVCENTHSKKDNNFHKGPNLAVWNILQWFCSGQGQESCVDNHLRLQHCKNPFVRNLLQKQ